MSEMGADAAVSGKDREECRRSDGTLILAWGAPTGGTDFTIQMAEKRKKPYLVIDLGETEDPTGVVNWIETHGIAVLNVPAPRESKVPGIHKRSITFLHQVFKDLSLKGWDEYGRKTGPQGDGWLCRASYEIVSEAG